MLEVDHELEKVSRRSPDERGAFPDARTMAARISGAWIGHTGRNPNPRSMKTLIPTAPMVRSRSKRATTSSGVATGSPTSGV